jgi:hypothetical protein
MKHFYKKYGTSTTKSLLRIQHDTHKIVTHKICENSENIELAVSLYAKGVSLYGSKNSDTHASPLKRCNTLQSNLLAEPCSGNTQSICNEVIQLLTVSADLGYNDAIKWLIDHDSFVTKCLAEQLEVRTYKIFIDRCNMQHNKYSLNMLGVINNACNNPDFWGKQIQDEIFEQQNLARMYYTQSGDKGNPIALLNLAYMLYDDYNKNNDSEYDLPDKLRDEIKVLIDRAKILGIEDKILKGIV